MSLHVDGISAGYNKGVPVLKGLTLEVGSGSMVALLGRNGAGKSTLLKTIIGEIKPSQGRIHHGQVELTSLAPHQRARAGLAYVPQGRQIFSGLSVTDNIRVAARATRRGNWQLAVDEAFELFPALHAKRNQQGGALSGGQQQILALARALATSPDFLLLDEPTEGIQPSIVDSIAVQLIKVNQERGIGMVVVEQNLEFATTVATDVHLIDRGMILESLPAHALLADRSRQQQYLGV